MSYNRKIIQTASYIEVYEYEKIIFTRDENTKNTEPKKERKKKRNFDELSTEEQNERLERISKTRKNSRFEVMRLVDTNFDKRTSFLTLTTKENIQDRNQFNLLFNKFIKRLNYKIFKSKKQQLHYLAVLEKQRRRAYHAHIMLFDFPFIPQSDLVRIWGLGGVWINKIDVDSKENRGRYVSKYFEKGIGQELLESYGKKSFYSSRNLKKPEVLKFVTFEETENIIKHNEVLYETEYSGKIFKNGELLENRIKYKKIKID
ncbi:rolling circle replication-associated protein [Lactococcus lactis]|uniref:rolling circle replication-associated protein n=1 Tax=Lactococcus lactis TaxID=1358 RepID=UPI003219EC1F